MQISLSVETKLEDSFETTISARKILDITRALPEKSKLNIQINDTTVLVKALKSKFNLQTLAAQDYPVMKKDEEENTFVKLKQKDFKAILKQVDFSMAQQDIRYYLNGLLFEVDNQKLNIVGTDGHRLSFTSIKLQKDFGKIQTIVCSHILSLCESENVRTNSFCARHPDQRVIPTAPLQNYSVVIG